MLAMSLEGRCIDCGAAKISGDLDYEKWGGYAEDYGWVMLCPYHYAEYLKNEKLRKRNSRRYAFIKKQLKKIFPEAINWIEGESYEDGCEMTEKLENIKIFNSIKDRMEKILKEFNAISPIFTERQRKHIKDILFDKCYICKYWDDGSFCRASNTSTHDAIIKKMKRGNYGCGKFKVQSSMSVDLRYYGDKLKKWKRNKAGLIIY